MSASQIPSDQEHQPGHGENLLFTGSVIAYNADEPAFDVAAMYGFIKNQHGVVEVANRIFETRLYNLYKIYHGKEYNNRVQLYKDIESDPVLFRQNT